MPRAFDAARRVLGAALYFFIVLAQASGEVDRITVVSVASGIVNDVEKVHFF